MLFIYITSITQDHPSWSLVYLKTKKNSVSLPINNGFCHLSHLL